MASIMAGSNSGVAALLQLFVGLGSTDELVIEDTYYKLKDFLSRAGNSQYITSNEVAPFIQAGIRHPDPLVRALTVHQLAVCVDSVPNSIQFLTYNNLIPSVVGLFQDELSVVKELNKLFLQLAAKPEGMPLIFEEKVTSALQNAMKEGSVQLRIMELFAEISRLSEDLFRLSESQFLLPLVQSLHTTSDALRKLNIVELIEKISSTRWGIEFTSQSGTLTTFFNALNNFVNGVDGKTSRSDSFLTNKIISFVGHTAQDNASASLILQVPFLDIISYHLENHFKRNSNYFPENTEASATAVGEIGRSTAGLDAILSHPTLLPRYVDLFESENTPILICAFHSFGLLFTSPDCQSNTEKLEKIYAQLPSPFMKQVMKYVQKPFEDTRYSVYHFIQGLTFHKWGVIVLLNHPGFFEWLMNRGTELTKPGKEWKFAIVQKILQLHQDLVMQSFGTEKIVELQVFIRRGVFFVNPEVAMEIATKV